MLLIFRVHFLYIICYFNSQPTKSTSFFAFSGFFCGFSPKEGVFQGAELGILCKKAGIAHESIV